VNVVLPDPGWRRLQCFCICFALSVLFVAVAVVFWEALEIDLDVRPLGDGNERGFLKHGPVGARRIKAW
jgi:hypothetical protein